MIVSLLDLTALTVKARGLIDKIYLHWSAGRYNQSFDDYHINILGDGRIDLTCKLFSDLKSHTWKRNSGAIGISLSAMYNGKPDNFGQYPPTPAQIETLAQVVAKLCVEIGLPINSNTVMTHAEAADNLDGLDTYEPYGPNTTWERWDLWKLSENDEPYSGGNIVRGKAIYYAKQWGCI